MMPAGELIGPKLLRMDRASSCGRIDARHLLFHRGHWPCNNHRGMGTRTIRQMQVADQSFAVDFKGNALLQSHVLPSISKVDVTYNFTVFEILQ